MLEYYTIAVISLLAAISPGPDFFIVVKNALSHNRGSAIATSIGIGIGSLIHSTYCILGLAVIISESVLLFNVIKYLGATYLIYLGVKSLISKGSSSNPLEKKYTHSKMTYARSFRDGFLTNMLNPKCTLFILSVFTLMVKPNTPIWAQSIYGLEICLIAITWFIFLSCVLTHRRIKERITKVQHLVNKVIGVVLLGLGCSVMLRTG